MLWPFRTSPRSLIMMSSWRSSNRSWLNMKKSLKSKKRANRLIIKKSEGMSFWLVKCKNNRNWKINLNATKEFKKKSNFRRNKTYHSINTMRIQTMKKGITKNKDKKCRQMYKPKNEFEGGTVIVKNYFPWFYKYFKKLQNTFFIIIELFFN